MPPHLAQHFLIDPRVAHDVVATLGIRDDDTVIEIGPGGGALSRVLLAELDRHRATHFFAIERDTSLAEELRRTLHGKNAPVEIITGNALSVLPALLTPALDPQKYCIVGNIPYYITGRLLRVLGELQEKPRCIVLTLQREVAERLSAQPPHMNLLAATLQAWAVPEIIRTIPASAFRPPPKVTSAIVRLTPRAEDVPSSYYTLVRVLFKQPRKTIWNNLADGSQKLGVTRERVAEFLATGGISPHARPGTLSIDEIRALARKI